MPDVLAFVAETNTAQRQLMAGTLELVGYQVRSSSTPLQLNVELHSTAAFTARALLLVLDPSFGSECGRALVTLQRGRHSAGLRLASVILTRGARPADGIDMGPREVAHVLAFPFDSAELERLARHCLGTNGSSRFTR